METTLHQQLKTLYATGDQKEVTLDQYRIDAIDEQGRLVEVQCAGLSAIRDKIRKLVKSHDVVVVKPIIMRKTLVKRNRKRGKIVSRRKSPSKGDVLDLFDDLIHFCTVFPHDRLTLELAFVEIEEHRLPPLKKRWTRKRYRVEDRVLLDVIDRVQLTKATDLNDLLPNGLPVGSFTTRELAEQIDQPRWIAQKVAYCLRKTGAVEAVGKQRNAIVYQEATTRKAA
ncbi:MAG: hypothetical protein AB8G99_14185 [Planctomycetaceae bacterium]